MSMRTDDEQQITVPVAWVGTHLDHGYAMTCHKAQGAIVDVALLYGAGALTRVVGYVALSRGRIANHLYVPDDSDPDERPAPAVSREAPATTRGSAEGRGHPDVDVR